MTGEQIIALAMKRRTEQGLRLEWRIPGEENFTAYPKDEETKQRWIEKGQRKGWELI